MQAIIFPFRCYYIFNYWQWYSNKLKELYGFRFGVDSDITDKANHPYFALCIFITINLNAYHKYIHSTTIPSSNQSSLKTHLSYQVLSLLCCSASWPFSYSFLVHFQVPFFFLFTYDGVVTYTLHIEPVWHSG